MKLVLAEFNFWIIMFTFLQTVIAWSIVKYRQNDFGGIGGFALFYVNGVTTVFFAALDAAPSYPRKYKILAILLLMLMQAYWLLYYTSLKVYDPMWDEPVCNYSPCFTPRGVILSSFTTGILFLGKMLYQCARSRPHMMLIQIPVAYTFGQ